MSFPTAPTYMDAFLSFAPLIVVKTTLLLAISAGIAATFRNRSAALRHLLWSLAIGGAVALPVVAVFGPTLHLLPARRIAAEADARGLRAGPPTGEARQDAGPSVTKAMAPESDSAPGTPLSLPAVALVLWAAGLLALLTRFGIGMRQVRQLVERAAPVADEQWARIADRVRAADATPAFDLRMSDEVEMPFATGLLRPTIVLPASSWKWTLERREAVLLHEVAHLHHGDLIMNALSHLARAIYWFNPLAWYASRRLRIEAERACDDAVLRRGALASDYADHLLSIASSAKAPMPSVALAMARPSAFEGRLLAILEPGIERAAPSRVRTALTVAAFVAMILPLAAASPTARAAALPRATQVPPQQAQQPEPPRQPRQPQQTATRAELRSSAVVPALIEALDDANAAVRLAAVNSLGTLGDPRAIAALGKVLKDDSDARVRRAAAEALGEIDDPRAVPHLLDALKAEKVADVREKIVQSLAQLGDASAVPGIAAAANDASAATRHAVAEALGELETQSAVPTLVGMARDQDVDVRHAVAEALGRLESAAGLDALVGLARDSDADVRASAIESLSRLEDPRTLSTFVAALADASADVRSKAAEGFHRVPELHKAPAALLAALGDVDHDVRKNVAEALGSIGDEAAVPALNKALADSNADVRRAVAEALAEIGGPDAITSLMGLLKDPDPQIRKIVAEALGRRR